jgi:hypothetical protein
MRTTTSNEFDNFDRLATKLLKVTHSELKAKLDAEKRAKAQKKKRKAKPSASRDSGEGA